jgi:hypothetical protein
MRVVASLIWIGVGYGLPIYADKSIRSIGGCYRFYRLKGRPIAANEQRDQQQWQIQSDAEHRQGPNCVRTTKRSA